MRVPRYAWMPVLCFLICCAAPLARAQSPSPDTGGTEPPEAPPPPQSMPTDSTVSWTKAVQQTRDQMTKRLAKVIFNVPRPSAPFTIPRDGTSQTISEYTGIIKGSTKWAPIEAWAERDFQSIPQTTEEDDAEGEVRTVEILIALNGVRGLTMGIASKADAPHLFDLPGALAIQQTTVGDSTRTDARSDKAPEPITLLRVYIVGPSLEEQLRAKFTKSGGYPGFGPGRLPSDHPDMVRTIIAEFYGTKSDVESLAKQMDVPTLRKLLDP